MKLKINRIKEIIKNFKNTEIFVVGDIIYDEYIYGEVARISPEAPVPVVNVKKITFSAGGAANVCKNISDLGAKVSLCGVIGSDSAGNKLMDYFKENKISTDSVIISDDRPTTKKTRVIAQHQQVVRIDNEQIIPIDFQHQKLIIEKIKGSLKKVKAVIYSDYGKGVITKNILLKSLSYIKNNKKLSIVDPKPDNFKYYKNASVMTPNKNEVSKGLKVDIKNENDIINSGNKILNSMNLDALLITRSEEGMSLFYNSNIYNLPTIAQEVYDVTGAGDTVASLLGLCLASGATYLESAIIANIAAGIVVKEIGCASVTTDELLKNIKDLVI